MLALPAHAINIDTVPVGNPGNVGRSGSGDGAVPYAYRIAKYEVTNAQYVAFLNGVDSSGANALALYNRAMMREACGGIDFIDGAAIGSKYQVKTGRDNNPVVYVSWFDAVRFTNWLHNGQGAADTETGAYTLLGGTPIPSNSNTIARAPNAKWWLPNQNEWYKAAYHKNDGVTSHYWDYATASVGRPYSDQPPGSDVPVASRAANYFNDNVKLVGYDDGYAVTGSPTFSFSQNYLTDVGAYTAAVGPYGTYDQAGNVEEWIETANGFDSEGVRRGYRGGAWYSFASYLLHRNKPGEYPLYEFPPLGFRVAGIVPEPSAIFLAVVALAMLAAHRSRKLTAQQPH